MGPNSWILTDESRKWGKGVWDLLDASECAWYILTFQGVFRVFEECVRACVFVHVCANCMCVCACLYVCVCVCVLALIRSHTQTQASFPDEVCCLQSQEVLIVMRYWRHP